jgi:phage-related tail protein
MVPVLLVVLALILCSGVGWRAVSRLRSDIRDLDRRTQALHNQYLRLRDDLGSTDAIAVSALEGLFSHECKPATHAHTRPSKKAPAKKAAAKKAPAKRAPAKKAATRAR